jgi:hypothetical protein
VADRALEVLEVELLLGQPLMPILRVALKADSYPFLLGEIPEGGSSMGVMALIAEPVADLGVLALVILAYDLFMTLRAVDHAHPLGMGKSLDIGMAINTLQVTVDRGTKPLIIHIEGKFPLSHLLFPGGRDDHLEPLFLVHLEDIAGPMTFETCLIPYGKSHPCPHEKGKKYQQHQPNSKKGASNAYPPLFIRN